MMDDTRIDVVMISADGKRTRWSREAWNRMQEAMAVGDKELVTAIYLSGEIIPERSE